MGMARFKIVQSIVERLPRAWAYALAVFAVGCVVVLAARPARLEFNLKVVCPEASPPRFAGCRGSTFATRQGVRRPDDAPRTRVAEMRPLMHVEGWEHLEQARSDRKGVMVVSCTWARTRSRRDLVGDAGACHVLRRGAGATLAVRVVPRHPSAAWHQRLPLDLAGLRKVTQALRDNELVITAIDRDITEPAG